MDTSRQSSFVASLNRITPLIEAIVWGLFVVSLVVAARPDLTNATLAAEPFLEVTGLTRVMWPYATLITGVVLNFSRRYMAGNHRLGFFFYRCLFFLLSVMLLSATDYIPLFLLSWLAMGWFMAELIGHKIDWPQARAAGRLALQYFLAGTLYLSVGILVLFARTNSYEISVSLERLHLLSTPEITVVTTCVFLAAIIQSALFPVQNWLMSSMTAPTPASALMHAGFVNAGGILLTKFSPLLTFSTNTMLILAGVGTVSAIMGKIWKMVQTAVKRELGCSTIGQMGFMLLQCGLGYFSAAVTHLMLHGFYKGYLFLSSGSSIEQKSPKKSARTTWGPGRILYSLLTGFAAAALFVWITGKGTHFNSGLVLVFIIVFTLLHSSHEITSRMQLSHPAFFILFPLVVFVSTATYALIFNGVTGLMYDLPNIVAPTPFSWIHALIIAAFTGTWLAVELRILQRSRRLYVSVLNASQPHPATIVSSKEEYHV